LSINLKAELISSELYDTYYQEFANNLLREDPLATLLQEGECTWIGSNLVGVLQGERAEKENDIDQLVCTLVLENGCVPCDLYDVIDSQLRIETFHTIPLLMGFLAYELLHTLELVPHTRNRFPSLIPSVYFGLYSTIYEIIEGKGVYRHSVNWTLDGKSLPPLLCDKSAKGPLPPPKATDSPSISLRLDNGEQLDKLLGSNFSRTGYIAAVKEIKNQIKRGEYYQINLSQQLKFPLNEPRETVLQRATRYNNAPRKGIIQARFGNSLDPSALRDNQNTLIVSISPELFFEMHDGKIYCSPIKGTRKRSQNSTKDYLLLEDLLNSPKDNSELSMIVDLVRNDLSRICSIGSVEVISHRATSSLEHVHHTYSTVAGTLLPGTCSREIIAALYPCGSITGAPKIASMKEIADLEGIERGPYCGAIGYWGSNHSAHFNVAIRTATIFGTPENGSDLAVVNSGGGITLNSDEESEYIETLHKLKSILSLIL
jgi:para-aminobenzoate synthetase component 1